MLQQESGTTRVIDPWGGSYYVEKLTYDLARRAWQHISEVEQAGGMAKAIDEGLPKMRIEEAAARTQARIDSGRQPVIGVNKYRLAEEDMIDVLKVDNAGVRAGQAEKLQRLRAERDGAAVAAALAALTNAAGSATATCSSWRSTRRARWPRSARSPTRSRRYTVGTRRRSGRSPACTARRPARWT